MVMNDTSRVVLISFRLVSLGVYDKMGWGVRSNYVGLPVNELRFMQGA